jgi:RNA polymerase sigma factor (TIGR02999 family)
MSDAAPPDTAQVTRLLRRLQDGEAAALDQLFPLVYLELRAAAARALGRERTGHTLQPTDLVHEAWLKLAGGVRVEWQGRAHFLAVAARAMRQVLVDHARRKGAGKRGANAVHVTLGQAGAQDQIAPEDLLALDAALDRLGERDVRLREVVECRFFGGLTEKEIAEALGVTERTVQRDWVRARAWLHQEIYPEAGPA